MAECAGKRVTAGRWQSGGCIAAQWSETESRQRNCSDWRCILSGHRFHRRWVSFCPQGRSYHCKSAAVVDSIGMCRRVCEVLAGIKLKKCIVYHRNNGRKTIGAAIWRDAVYSFWHIGSYCVICQL